MKKVIVITVFLGYCLFVQGQYVQSGKVRKHNSGKEPLFGVAISALGAPPARTDNIGQFNLVFDQTTKHPGEKISFLEVLKTGFEVVNYSDVNNARLAASPKDTFHIIMAPQGQVAHAINEYYNLSYASLTKRYQHSIDSLKEALNQSKIDQVTFANIARQAEENYQFARKQLEELAQKFARKNLDDVSALYRQAFEQFKQGQILKAIQLLSQLELQAEEFQAQYRRGDSIVQEGENIKKQAREGLKKVAETFVLQANLHLAVFDIDAALKAYRDAIQIDSTNREIMLEYASFLYHQNLWLELPDVYAQAMAASSNAIDSSEVWQLKGQLFVQLNQIDKADSCLQIALAIQEAAYPSNTLFIAPYLIQTLGAFAYLFDKQNKASEALRTLKRAISLNKQLENVRPNMYRNFQPELLWGIGSLYNQLYQAELAEEELRNALGIYENIMTQDSSDQRANMGDIYLELAKVYDNIDQASKTLEMLHKAIGLYSKLYRENPAAYKPNIASLYQNLAAFHDDHHQPDSAIIFYEKGIALFEELVQDNPLTYSPKLSDIYDEVGNFGEFPGGGRRAVEYHQKAIEILTPFYERQPNVYAPQMFIYYNNIGNTYTVSLDDTDKAEEYYSKAKAIFESIIVEELVEPEPFVDDYGTLLTNLAVEKFNQYDIKESEKYYNQALDWYERYLHINPPLFRFALARLKLRIAYLEEEKSNIDKAIAYGQEALDLFRDLARTDSIFYEPRMGIALKNLCYFYYSSFVWNKRPPEHEIVEALAQEGILLMEKYPKAYESKQTLQRLKSTRQFFRDLPPPHMYSKVRKAENFAYQADVAYARKDFEKAIIKEKKALELFQLIHEYDTTKSSWKRMIDNEYSSLANCYLFTHQLSLAEAAAKQSFKFGNYYMDGLASFALALLLQGKWDACKAFMDQTFSESSNKARLKEGFLNEVDELERYGITHPDFGKFRALCNS